MDFFRKGFFGLLGEVMLYFDGFGWGRKGKGSEGKGGIEY